MSWFANIIHRELRLFFGQNIQNDNISKPICSKSCQVPKDSENKPNGSSDWSGVEYAFPWINFIKYYASCVDHTPPNSDSSDEEAKGNFNDDERRLYWELRIRRHEIRRMRDEHIIGAQELGDMLRENRRALNALYNSARERGRLPREENRLPSPELIREGTIIVSPERKVENSLKNFFMPGDGNGCKEKRDPCINLNLAAGDNLGRIADDLRHRNRRRVQMAQRFQDTLSSNPNLNHNLSSETNIGLKSDHCQSHKNSESSQSKDFHTQGASSSNAPSVRQRHPSGAQERRRHPSGAQERHPSGTRGRRRHPSGVQTSRHPSGAQERSHNSQNPASYRSDLFGESSKESTPNDQYNFEDNVFTLTLSDQEDNDDKGDGDPLSGAFNDDDDEDEAA